MFNKKTIKRIILSYIVTLIISSLNISIYADEVLYTSLGDSIAAGYGLPKSESGYVELISSEIDLEVQNLAVPGLNSEQLLQKIKNLQGEELENLKNAKLITVSIGSNDILGPFLNMTASSFSGNFNFNMDDYDDYDDFDDALEAASEIMDAGLEDLLAPYSNVFKKNLPLIITEIKSINPSAQLVFTNFYNPFKNIEIPVLPIDVNIITDNLMQLLNDILYQECNDDFLIADVYAAFEIAYNEGKSPVNVSALSTAYSLDPHPNAYGHELIKQAILKVVSVDEINNVVEADIMLDEEPIQNDISSANEPIITNFIQENQTQQEISSQNDTQKSSPETGIASQTALLTGTMIAIVGIVYVKKKK